MFRVVRLLPAAVLFVHCAGVVTAKCYTPDGGEAASAEAGPCSSDPSNPLSNVCCNVNRSKAPGTSTNASEIRDECLPNGLCENTSLLNDGSVFVQWGRDFCTNPDWSTGQCLDVCADTATDRSGFKRVIPCSGKNNSIAWCCGDSNACCDSTDSEDLFSLSPTFTIRAASSTSSVPSSTLSTTSVPSSTAVISTSSSREVPTSTNPVAASNTAAPTVQDTGLSRGSKAGIAIGAVVGAVLLVALGVWISKAMAWRSIAQAHKKNDPAYDMNSPGSDAEGLYGHHPQKYARYAEVDGTTPPVEILSYRDPVEVPDTQVNFYGITRPN